MKFKITNDSIISLVLFILGAVTYFFVIPSQIQLVSFSTYGLSPYVFPKIAAAGFSIFAVALFWQSSFKNKDDDDTAIEVSPKTIKIMLFLIAYLILMAFAGFYFSSAIFLFTFMVYLSKENYFKYIIVIAGFLLINYIIFEKLLRCVLPRGAFFE